MRSPSPAAILAGATPAGDAAAGARTDRSALYQQIRAVFEGFALLVALIAVERLFLGRGTYAGLGLHPFWLPVLLVSLQHGLFGGVATAILASWLADWPIRAPGQDIAAHYFQLVRLPVQWLLVALAIGVFRQAQIRAEAERDREITRLRQVNDRFAAEVARLDDELWRFEMRTAIDGGAAPDAAAAGGGPVRHALARLAALRSGRPEQLGARFAVAAEALLGPVPVRLLGVGADGPFDLSPGRAPAGLAVDELRDRLAGTAEAEEEAESEEEAPGIAIVPVAQGADEAPAAFIVAGLDLRGPAGIVRGEALRQLADAVGAALAVAAHPERLR
jgi:hypothetical protein